MNHSYVFNQTGLKGTGSASGIRQTIKFWLRKLAVMSVVLFLALTSSAQYYYTDSSGSFDDGSGSYNYADYTDQSYLIQPPGAVSIELYFYSFDIEADYDFVYVYDGADESAPLIGRYHNGNLPPYSIQSTGGSLYLRFTSNWGNNYEGWSVYYTGVIQNPAFNEFYTDPSGTFDDSSGAALYPNLFTGTYLIQPAGASTVTLSFPSFNTEANYDYVYVYNGADTSAPLIGQYHNGNLPPATITSSGPSLFIRFTTDGSVNYDGWTARYSGNGGGATRALTPSSNYIYSIAPQEAMSSLSSDYSKLSEEVVYFDGLGRPKQTVGIQAGPNGQDIVTPVTYDSFGREDTKYLPYATTAAGDGTFKPTAMDVSYSANCDHYKFYNTQTNSVVNDPKPFSKTDFEPSPLNRVLRQGSPGAVWQPGTDPATDRSVKMGYSANTADNVRMWTVASGTPTATTFYPANSLYKTTTWDENNQANGTTSRSEEFKDKQGKVILKRSYNGSEKFSTYYVYDDLDLLRFVLTPKAMENDALEANELNELCYQYTYDYRKRMNGKKLPGADWVYMVYDKRDRLVATQDGVQRVAGRWLITKYDQLNRPVITALKSLGDTPSALETYFNSYPDGASYFESRNSSSVGYTLGNSFGDKLSVTESDLLSVTYYDTYGFPGVRSFDTGVRVSDYYNPATGSYFFDRLKGQVTGTRVKVLDGTENQPSGYRWLTTTSYYDERYRVIQTLGDLYSPTWSDNEVTSTLYDFTGKVLKTQTRQVFSGQTNTVLQTNTYDQAGRLTQVKHRVNTGTEVTLASMEYNEVGQLKQKSLHGAVGSGIQNLNYAYNIRGWLERINNPDVNPSASSSQKLNLGLYYNSVPSGFSCPAQYNGNISAMAWNTPGQAGALSPADKQGYGFTYDGLNRLLTSSYGEGATFATYAGANNENVTYDKNGNILTLVRYKKETGEIDNLSYSYRIINGTSSNMLDRVDDGKTVDNGFTELVKQTGEYGYDQNGNLTSDLNKGYNSIQYNFLNLPKRVGTSSQYITYIYSADGTKLAKVGTNNVVTTYAGSFVYEGSSLKYMMHPEGMYLPGGNYQYYLKDHLGNTRLVVNTSGVGGTVVQQTDYYPFGMDIASYNGGVENRYRYNGKELQTDNINGKKLDWYDYGARFYDPAIGRWHTPDPMTEMYNSNSPYAYVKNNPISSIDPNGMYSVFFNGQEVSGSDKKYLQGYYGMPDDSKEGNSESQEPEKNPSKSINDAFSITKKVKDFFGIGLNPDNLQDRENLQYAPKHLEQALVAIETVNGVLMVLVPVSSVAELMANVQSGHGAAALATIPFVVLDAASFGAGSGAKSGYKTFAGFKKAFGAAGEGMAWHHIVEQTPSNIFNFGPEAIHNIDNIIKLPHGKGSIHAKISGFYSSKPFFTNGVTVRQWLSTKSFEEQLKFGIETLERYMK